MSIFTYQHRIQYSNVGKDNTLSLKSLVTLLQDTAGMQSAMAGYSSSDIPTTHAAWIVLDWKVKMFLHPHCDELLTIHTWPRTMDKLYSYRDFEVYNAQNELVAIASSKWFLLDTKTKKIKRITDDIYQSYGGITQKDVFDHPMEEKIKIPTNLHLSFSNTPQRRDIDTNGHVNNLHYIDYALEALPEDIYNHTIFENLEIIYKKEIKYKEKINAYYSFENNKHIVTIQNENNSIVHAIIKLY